MLCQLVLQEKCCMQLFCGVQGITHGAWHLLAPLIGHHIRQGYKSLGGKSKVKCFHLQEVVGKQWSCLRCWSQHI